MSATTTTETHPTKGKKHILVTCPSKRSPTTPPATSDTSDREAEFTARCSQHLGQSKLKDSFYTPTYAVNASKARRQIGHDFIILDTTGEDPKTRFQITDGARVNFEAPVEGHYQICNRAEVTFGKTVASDLSTPALLSPHRDGNTRVALRRRKMQYQAGTIIDTAPYSQNVNLLRAEVEDERIRRDLCGIARIFQKLDQIMAYYFQWIMAVSLNRSDLEYVLKKAKSTVHTVQNEGASAPESTDSVVLGDLGAFCEAILTSQNPSAVTFCITDGSVDAMLCYLQDAYLTRPIGKRNSSSTPTARPTYSGGLMTLLCICAAI